MDKDYLMLIHPNLNMAFKATRLTSKFKIPTHGL